MSVKVHPNTFSILNQLVTPDPYRSRREVLPSQQMSGQQLQQWRDSLVPHTLYRRGGR